MPTHDPVDPKLTESENAGYEITDVNVNGIVVFLASLGAFVAVFFVFCFGMGKVINTAILKSDGPPNKWNMIGAQPQGKRQDLTSNAVMEQNQLNQMVQRFPTPRLQTDDGNEEIAEMHAREDLLLNNYSWVDRTSGKVRIPITRAMQIIAEHGLPVAPQEEQTQPLMAGDRVPVVTMPLTDGFARTGYEQQYLETLEQQKMRGEKPGEQAALGNR
ncbi:MAG TPA: hypothetical protein VN828_11065 [Acidobacteriaceae bacterium]|nr:hypothetical protein [Acidobacteriaceae bacterium]